MPISNGRSQRIYTIDVGGQSPGVGMVMRVLAYSPGDAVTIASDTLPNEYSVPVMDMRVYEDVVILLYPRELTERNIYDPECSECGSHIDEEQDVCQCQEEEERDNSGDDEMIGSGETWFLPPQETVGRLCPASPLGQLLGSTEQAPHWGRPQQ